eukprot:scaffold4406_cov112-Isochrysis_galbana.AAC.14
MRRLASLAMWRWWRWQPLRCANAAQQLLIFGCAHVTSLHPPVRSQVLAGIRFTSVGSRVLMPTSWAQFDEAAGTTKHESDPANATMEGTSTIDAPALRVKARATDSRTAIPGVFGAVVALANGACTFSLQSLAAANVSLSVRDVKDPSHAVASKAMHNLRFKRGAATRLRVRLAPGARAVAGERTHLQVRSHASSYKSQLRTGPWP